MLSIGNVYKEACEKQPRLAGAVRGKKVVPTWLDPSQPLLNHLQAMDIFCERLLWILRWHKGLFWI